MPGSKTIAAGVRRVRFGLALLGGLVAVQTSKGQTPPPGGYQIYTLGLTGTGYEYLVAGYGTYRLSNPSALNAAGQVIGSSERYNASGTNLGADAWVWTGSTAQQIGLTGPGYEYAYPGTGSGTYRFNTPWSLHATPSPLNAAGQVIGRSRRYNASGGALGQDAWLWTGSATQQIGLTGPGYEYAYTGTGGGTYRYNSASALNDTGQAIGYSTRFNASGGAPGQDAWLWTGSATQQIGLTGPGYEYAYTGTGGGTYRYNSASALNDTGQAIGYSTRFNASGGALGQDAWLWTGSTTRQIGLTGTGYEYTDTAGGTHRSSTPSALNDAGQAIGYSNRYNASGNSLGQDAWLWNGSTARQIGLTGTGYEYIGTGGTVRGSLAAALNAAGQMIGNSVRYNASGTVLGRDSWMWNGSTTQLIRLTGTGGETINYSTAYALNAAGQAIGYNIRYNASGAGPGNDLGEDAWVWTGSTTRQIGLTGPGYEYAYTGRGGTFRVSAPAAINAAGQVIGRSSRYDASGGSLGEDAWFYDPVSDTTIPLRFSSSGIDGSSSSFAEVLTDNGVVLGVYELYSGTTDVGSRAFWWDEASGFYDLGALVDGGLTAGGWQSLADAVLANGPAGFSPVTGGSPWYIAGSGWAAGQNAFLLAVPEPTGGAMLLLAAGGLLARRRRAAGRNPAAG